ncbi:MAG: hypothetical protein IKB92_06260 [Clostridia bacterium]|nr:hypothetical protein [Clostridia bacterium]
METINIDKLVDEMSVEDLCGQLLNIRAGRFESMEEFERIAKRVRPGALFFGEANREMIKEYTDIVNKYTKVPVIISADIEHGPGCCVKGEPLLPEPMAWGACDDEELIEKAGQVTGEICRKNGIHWSFAPVVDININKDNPIVNVRAVSDKPEQVVKITGAYVRGTQKNGYLIAGCKHFPGDGVDDRNQHLCTTINSLSKEEWLKTYGYVYKEMFKIGSASVMVGHIALPDIEDEIDPVLGPKPGTLSKNVMTDLLRNELGFEGCIVSDAMPMVGASAMCTQDRLSIEFIKAGGDMVLFALERDFDYLMGAIESGEITMERLKDAVKHILRMKVRARLFEDQEKIMNEIELSGDISALSAEIAEKAITIVRNTQDLIPLKKQGKKKFLIINMMRNDRKMENGKYVRDMKIVAEELLKRGHEVDVMSSAGLDHRKIETERELYDCILLDCRISSRDYLGGTLRINSDNIGPFWRGVVVGHPCVIFTSFGDPYKLYDLPFLRTYVNAYSSSDDIQRAFVKVLLGEIPAVGKNPVALKGFFEREV